jgi:acyl carrier protein
MSMKQDEALAWIAKVFDDAVDRIRVDTDRKAIAGWDSMGTLMLLADLDEKFGIQIAEDDIEGLQSVKDILDVLRKHGALEAS